MNIISLCLTRSTDLEVQRIVRLQVQYGPLPRTNDPPSKCFVASHDLMILGITTVVIISYGLTAGAHCTLAISTHTLQMLRS
jgi:hypothetical protein